MISVGTSIFGLGDNERRERTADRQNRFAPTSRTWSSHSRSDKLALKPRSSLARMDEFPASTL
jgi:hypothetical protein